MKAAIDAVRDLCTQYQHTAASGTAGGPAMNGGWRVLPITNEAFDDIGCTLASNVITMPKGRYVVDYRHVFYNTNESMVRLITTPSGGAAAYHYSDVGCAYDGAITRGVTIVDFVASNGGTVRWEYSVQQSQLTDGLGRAASFGVTNIFGSVVINYIT